MRLRDRIELNCRIVKPPNRRRDRTGLKEESIPEGKEQDSGAGGDRHDQDHVVSIDTVWPIS